MMFNVFKGLKLYGIKTLPGVNRPAGLGLGANDWYADYVELPGDHPDGPGNDHRRLLGVAWLLVLRWQHGIAAALAELILSPVALVLPDTQAFASSGLSPLSAINAVGTTHTVTATTVSGGANPLPVPGVTITFDVISGPNNAGTLICAETGTNTNTTDANGHANCTCSICQMASGSTPSWRRLPRSPARSPRTRSPELQQLVGRHCRSAEHVSAGSRSPLDQLVDHQRCADQQLRDYRGLPGRIRTSRTSPTTSRTV